MSEKGPDRVNIRSKDREICDNLLEEEEGPQSPLEGQENRIPYMMALTRGFHSGERLDLSEEKTEGFILLSTLKDRDKALIKVIAISEEEDLSVLDDKKKVFNIADEYAAGGIHLLKNRIFGEEFGSYTKRLESELRKAYQNIPEVSEMES